MKVLIAIPTCFQTDYSGGYRNARENHAAPWLRYMRELMEVV